MEDEEVALDRRLFELYSYHALEDDDGIKHPYQLIQTGFRYVPRNG